MSNSISMGLFLTLLGSFIVAAFAIQPVQAISEDRIAIVVELERPSVAEIYTHLQTEGITPAALVAATQAQLAHIEQEQQILLAALAQLDAQVLYRNQRVYNGIALRLAQADVARLYKLPGVKAVHPLIPKTPANSVSVPWINAPSIWAGSGGNGATGENIRIAIIDTGIDYLHTAFGGPGVGYENNDPTRIGDVGGFPSAKIIGGYDFAGDSYNSNPNHAGFNPIPEPDPDPADCYAHGTAVAATAAGFGVAQNGATYSGPYDQHTDFSSLKIGPGVAPQAQLYALKVFGCAGSSEIVDMAIEWAVDPNGDGDFADHADVINLSLGSPYGMFEDSTALASENAAAVGVLVVAAAGNSGDVTYAISSPAVANHVISVAASQIPGSAFSQGDEGLAGFSARGPRSLDSALKPDLAAPGAAVFTASQGAGSGGRAVSGTSMATPQVGGAMALLRQHFPDRPAMDLKALVMNTATTQIRQLATTPAPYFTPARIGAGRIDLASAVAAQGIVYNADDPGLISISFGAPEVLGTSRAIKNVRIANLKDQPLTFAVTYTPIADLPGVEIGPTATHIAVPELGFSDMAVTMDVNAAALRHLRESTLHAAQAEKPRHWLSEESGYLLLWPLGDSLTTMLASAHGRSAAPQGTMRASYDPITRMFSYTLALQPVTTTVSAVYIGESVPITMEAAVGKLVLPASDSLRLRNGNLQVTVQTGDGELQGVVSWPTPVLSLPVYAAPRPVSALDATPTTLNFDNALDASRTFTISGAALTGSQPPTDVISLVSLAELHTASPRLPAGNELARYSDADLKYVGLARDVVAAGPANTMAASTLYFAIVTHANWSSPNVVEFNIDIDVDQDGNDDFILFNTDQISYNGASGTSDVFVTALRDLRTNRTSVQLPLNGFTPAQRNTALYNSNVMLLPVHTSALGLSHSHAEFRYTVKSYSDAAPVKVDGTRQIIDQTEAHDVSLSRPGLVFTTASSENGSVEGSSVLFSATDGTTVEVAFDLASYYRAGGKGVLVLYHHNHSAARASVISIQWTWPHTRYFPVIGGHRP